MNLTWWKGSNTTTNSTSSTNDASSSTTTSSDPSASTTSTGSGTSGRRNLRGNQFLEMKQYVKNRTLEKSTDRKLEDNKRSLQDDNSLDLEFEEEDNKVRIVNPGIFSV